MVFQTIPLSKGFMFSSILGLVIVAVYTASGRLSPPWGFSFGLVFVIMFISSVVSITPTNIKKN